METELIRDKGLGLDLSHTLRGQSPRSLPDRYLLLIDLLDARHRLGQLLLLPGEDNLCAVDAGRRDVDARPCLLHDLTNKSVIRPSDEGVEGLLHFQPLDSASVLERTEQSRGGSALGLKPVHTHPALTRPHLLGGDEQDFMACFLDAFFGTGDPDLIAGIIGAWDLDFGCSFEL